MQQPRPFVIFVALPFLCVPACSQQDPALVGCWDLDEGQGDLARDLSGHIS